MKDIYSPLEIDEEWDNYSPVDAAAPTIEAPATNVPVTSDNMNNLATSGIESGAADAGVNIEQYKKDAVADTGVDLSKLNNDPARDAANSIIATEQKTNDGAPAVEDNIAKWTANDGKDAEATASTDKLEFGDMGSKLDQDATNSYNTDEPKDSVKVNVSPAPDSAPAPAEASDSAENSNMNDVPKPVEIDMTQSEQSQDLPSNENDNPKTAADFTESIEPVMPEPTPAMPANEKSMEPSGDKEALSYEPSAIEDTKNLLKSKTEELNKELGEINKSIDDMEADKKDKTDAYNLELNSIEEGIQNAKAKKADLEKFIAQLEALK